MDNDGDGIEDTEENFLMSQIPKTSTNAVLGLALFVGILSGVAGFFFGRRRLTGDQLGYPQTQSVIDEVDSAFSEDEI